MRNNWQREIDSYNRKTTIKKRFDKALIPVRRLMTKIEDAKDCVVDSVTSYIENKRAQRIEKEEKQAFQDECRHSYNEFLNSFDRNQIGERFAKGTIGPDYRYAGVTDHWGKEIILMISEHTYVTDKGPITRKITKSSWRTLTGERVNPDEDTYNYKEEIEGFFKDTDGQYLYGKGAWEGLKIKRSFHEDWENTYVIVRDAKGQFVKLNGRDANDDIKRLMIAFKEAENTYNLTHKEQLGE